MPPDVGSAGKKSGTDGGGLGEGGGGEGGGCMVHGQKRLDCESYASHVKVLAGCQSLRASRLQFPSE